MINFIQLSKEIIEIATRAAEVILEIYQQSYQFKVQVKDDNSPVTQADLMAHDLIETSLKKLTPDWPILSEEGAKVPYSVRRNWSYYWLVDPLDGTREFIRHSGEFTVNIALMYRTEPVLGVLFVPVMDECYFAWKDGGAHKQSANGSISSLQVGAWQQGQTTILASHGAKEERLLDHLGYLGVNKIERLSSAWKFGLIADAKGDLYPRLGDTCEWDTAAGHCILQEAGGALVDLQGRALQYNLKESLINPHFMAIGDKEALMPALARIFIA